MLGFGSLSEFALCEGETPAPVVSVTIQSPLNLDGKDVVPGAEAKNLLLGLVRSG